MSEDFQNGFEFLGESQEVNGVMIRRAKKDGVWFHVTNNLEPYYNERYAFVGDFVCADGLWVARATQKRDDESRAEDWFHIGLNGEPSYPARYQFVDLFYEGFARVQRHDGKWLHIFPDGSPAYADIVFNAAHSFKDGKANVLDGENWIIITASASTTTQKATEVVVAA